MVSLWSFVAFQEEILGITAPLLGIPQPAGQHIMISQEAVY